MSIYFIQSFILYLDCISLIRENIQRETKFSHPFHPYNHISSKRINFPSTNRPMKCGPKLVKHQGLKLGSHDNPPHCANKEMIWIKILKCFISGIQGSKSYNISQLIYPEYIQVSKWEISQLDFYTQIDHKIFGLSNIYSSNKFPSCFVIKYTQTLKDIPTLQLFRQIQNQQNIYLLGLYGFRMGKDCDCSMKSIVSDSVTFYWEYLSFSLRDLIEERRKNRSQFQQSQVWHIIKASITGYQAFINVKSSYDFMPSKLMINSLGRVRLDWIHIQSKNSHWNFLKRINIQNHLPLQREQYFSPEELQALSQKQFTTKIDIEKVNIFSLGILLLECLSGLNPPQYFYSKFSINYQMIQTILSKLTAYSENLKILIGQMLRKDFKIRPSFQWIKKNYSKYLDGQQCIIIPKNEENVKRNFKPNSVEFFHPKLKDLHGKRNINE